MAFVNEVVSDQDIDRYGLPFEKGSGRWWTRDAERDFYLWGGKVGNPAFGEPIEACFRLYLNGEKYVVMVEPGDASVPDSDVPFFIVWKSVLLVSPSCKDAQKRLVLFQVLKEALSAYGLNGRAPCSAGECVVRFDF